MSNPAKKEALILRIVQLASFFWVKKVFIKFTSGSSSSLNETV